MIDYHWLLRIWLTTTLLFCDIVWPNTCTVATVLIFWSQAAFDRGSLVAIEPDDRARYASAPLGWIQIEIMCIYIITRKTPVSPSPKLSFVPFEFCSSCRRNAFFSFFKFKKMHFDLRPPMNLSTSILLGRRSVLWPCKKNVLHFRWQARHFLRFWHVLDGIFLLFF